MLKINFYNFLQLRNYMLRKDYLQDWLILVLEYYIFIKSFNLLFMNHLIKSICFITCIMSKSERIGHFHIFLNLFYCRNVYWFVEVWNLLFSSKYELGPVSITFLKEWRVDICLYLLGLVNLIWRDKSIWRLWI